MASRSVQELIATYRSSEDLISVGAYQPGINARTDRAVAFNDIINGFLRQGVYDNTEFKDVVNELISFANAKDPKSIKKILVVYCYGKKNSSFGLIQY